MQKITFVSVQLKFICVLLLSVHFGCGDSPDKLIKRDRMVDIYADVLILSSEYEPGEEPESYDERLDSVLTTHGVERPVFESSLDYYRKDPHRWKDLVQRVVSELEKRRDQVRDSPAARSSS